MPWIKACLLTFVIAEVALFAYARVTSGMAHLHAVQQVTDASPGGAASACSEAVSAISDFQPAIAILNLGKAVPLTSARAWGEVPRLAQAVTDACPSVELYGAIVPWRTASIQNGAAANLLAEVRRDRLQLAQAGEQLARAWSDLDRVDVQALETDPRLSRAARLIGSVRAQQADVSDVLALSTPDRIETLLGGRGPRSLVLSVDDGDASTQAYAVLLDGQVQSLDIGQPPVSAVASISVDRAGLAELVDATKPADLPAQPSTASVARAVLDQFMRMPVSDYERVVATLRAAAEKQHAWLSFADPALQEFVVRRGWVRQ
jgi:hypothetical protein